MNKFLASSSDTKQLSLTIKGAIVALGPVIALLIQYVGGEMSNDDIQTIAEYSANAVFAVGAVVSSIMMIVGILRKAYKSIFK